MGRLIEAHVRVARRGPHSARCRTVRIELLDDMDRMIPDSDRIGTADDERLGMILGFLLESDGVEIEHSRNVEMPENGKDGEE